MYKAACWVEYKIFLEKTFFGLLAVVVAKMTPQPNFVEKTFVNRYKSQNSQFHPLKVSHYTVLLYTCAYENVEPLH